MKRCPFCSNGNPRTVKKSTTFKWRVVCDDCGAEGPVAYTQQEAKDRWDHRQEEE